ncbi:MAG TPA: hypothetical protein VFZ43_09980 [Anaerolineales bacterium]
MKSKRGQAELGIMLIAAMLAIALLLIAMAANQRGMQAGAEVIGESVGEAIDSAIEPTFDPNAENDPYTLQIANIAMMALVANRHAIERHGVDAVITVDCWNRNGTWRVYREGNTIFHMLCKDDDGSIRDIILERRSNTSSQFDMRSAYTPRDGSQQAVLSRLEGLKAELHTKGFPKDMQIFVDGVLMHP